MKFVWLTTPFPETSSALGIDSSHSYSAVPTNAWAPTFSVWEQSPWLPFQILIFCGAGQYLKMRQRKNWGSLNWPAPMIPPPPRWGNTTKTNWEKEILCSLLLTNMWMSTTKGIYICSSQPSIVHWLSSSIFPFWLVVCPAMVTPVQISLLVVPQPLTHTFSKSLW